MKKPRFKMDCGECNCGDCFLNEELCDQFISIIDALNKIAGAIAKTPEEPKPHPQFKRGDRVQVSNNGFEWRGQYFVGIGDEPFPFIASDGPVVGWKHCRPYKDE